MDRPSFNDNRRWYIIPHHEHLSSPVPANSCRCSKRNNKPAATGNQHHISQHGSGSVQRHNFVFVGDAIRDTIIPVSKTGNNSVMALNLYKAPAVLYLVVSVLSVFILQGLNSVVPVAKALATYFHWAESAAPDQYRFDGCAIRQCLNRCNTIYRRSGITYRSCIFPVYIVFNSTRVWRPVQCDMKTGQDYCLLPWYFDATVLAAKQDNRW